MLRHPAEWEIFLKELVVPWHASCDGFTVLHVRNPGAPAHLDLTGTRAYIVPTLCSAGPGTAKALGLVVMEDVGSRAGKREWGVSV